MSKLTVTSNPKVKEVFDNYPKGFKKKLKDLRKLILDTAKETDGVEVLEETLKWGEPSYLVKKGSTIRLDWKKRSPDQYAIYFKCTSKLVSTFRAVYGNQFKYEKNRAILFQLNDKVPTKELKHCIQLALTYHKVKHLDLLGVEKK